MVSKFVERAKSVEPEGVVVLNDGASDADLTLEDGDVIVIPAKSDVVLVSGEVMVPQAMLWSEDKDLNDYVTGAGGYGNRADRDNVLILHQNGAVTRNSGKNQTRRSDFGPAQSGIQEYAGGQGHFPGTYAGGCVHGRCARSALPAIEYVASPL